MNCSRASVGVMSQGRTNASFEHTLEECAVGTVPVFSGYSEPPPSYDDVTKSVPRRDVVGYSAGASHFVAIPLQSVGRYEEDEQSDGRIPKTEVNHNNFLHSNELPVALFSKLEIFAGATGV